MAFAPTSQSKQLSVVVVVLDGGANLVRCLEALERQEDAPDVEIIAAHDDRLQEIERLRARFPAVQFVFHSARRNYPALRSAGVHASRGTVVGVTEDQCIPPARWCANIIAAHAAPHAAIGGPVEKQTPDKLLNWAVYLREFGDYMPPMTGGPSGTLTDCNVTYKRSALESIADIWKEEFHEPQVHGALQARGETLWLAPAVVTHHQRSLRLVPAIVERYRFGRLYGSLRAATLGAAKRLLLIVGAFLLPPLLLARVLFLVIRKRRRIGVCLAALPYLALFSAVWSWGEWLGYITRRAAKP